MLQRNLLYTGVTRGKRLVVLVGQKAVVIAVRNVSGRRRWSKLAEWLSADVSKHYVSDDVGRHRATSAVARLFGERESGEQVNCVVLSMLQACPLYHPIVDVSPRCSEPPLIECRFFRTCGAMWRNGSHKFWRTGPLGPSAVCGPF